MTDEEKVRAAWEPEEIKVSGHASPDEISAAWAAAAEFTAKHKQAIADVDEEIALLEGVSTTTAAFISSIYVAKHIKQDAAKEAPVWQRILKSREAHRAELARGMKA